MKVIEKIKQIFYGFYAKGIYINFLMHVKQNQENEGDRYRNNYSLILKDALINEFNYKEYDINLAKQYLIHGGYIGESKNVTFLYVTDEGEKFFQDYYRFRLLGKLGKLTSIFNKNFVVIFSVLSLLISISSLSVSLFNNLHKNHSEIQAIEK
ncbi:MAG: hypothetical protein P4M14_11210 [Gammaproteobacteria bacterium]|nr:hypothetical protein [Gammaproteobacteria bacterium]